jgi:hypothetical protein
VSIRISEGLAVADGGKVDYIVETNNGAPARRDALAAAVAGVGAKVEAGSLHEAQGFLKLALEMIHELADGLGRGEWTQAGWGADAIGEWHAHLGARNVVHHTSISPARMHSGPVTDERLRWRIDAREVQGLRSKRQAGEYLARLVDQPVLPPLRALSARVSAAIA